MQVVAEANKPEWSGGHKGLQLYLHRLVHPMWDAQLLTPSKSNPASLVPNLTEDNLKVGSFLNLSGWKCPTEKRFADSDFYKDDTGIGHMNQANMLRSQKRPGSIV